MNPFIELMQAAALIMLLFGTVLIAVVIRNTGGPKARTAIGPAVIGIALLLFAVPIYAAVIGTNDFDRFSAWARGLGAILLPLGLYLLGREGAQLGEPGGIQSE